MWVHDHFSIRAIKKNWGMKGRIQLNIYKENYVEQKNHDTWSEYKRVKTYSLVK
jgi:hypothetical protein